MKLTVSDVDRISDLAKLKLSETEKESLLVDMNKILEYVEMINEVDLSDVQPTTHVQHTENVFREDEIKPYKDFKAILKNAPEKIGNFYKVPKVVDKEVE